MLPRDTRDSSRSLSFGGIGAYGGPARPGLAFPTQPAPNPVALPLSNPLTGPVATPAPAPVSSTIANFGAGAAAPAVPAAPVASPLAPAPDAPAGAAPGAGGFMSGMGGFLGNMDNLEGLANIIGSFGGLYNAFQQNKIAQKSLDFQEGAYNTNLASTQSSYNLALEDRIRARYAQEGRSGQAADAYISKYRLGD